MKTSTKVTIGLSVAAAASVATAVVVSGKVMEKIHHMTTRTKVKNSSMTNLMEMKITRNRRWSFR